MGGQVLGGGVIVLVAVALWLVYLLPSWQSRHRFTSAERNAVRLGQALRVLAETSETPREVHLELTARTAHQQQKLAKQVQAQKAATELAEAKARLEIARVESARDRDLVKEQRAADLALAKAERQAAVELAKAERAVAAEIAKAEREAAVEIAKAERAAAAEIAKAERAAAVAQKRAEHALAVQRARRERDAAAGTPETRRARARRRFRLVLSTLALTGAVALGLGVTLDLTAFILVGGAVVVASGSLLQRLSRVARRADVRPAVVAAPRVATPVQDFAVAAAPKPTWTPRELPRPLVASAGSRAAAVLDEQAAREALRAAARERAVAEELAAASAPTPIETARPAAASPYVGMGYVDDAEIEDHVRRLLERRAATA